MKYAADSFFPKVSNQPGSYLYITHLDIIHMGIVAAFLRHIRLFDLTFLCKMSQIFMIIIVYLHSFGKNLISCFQLCIKICCIQLTWKIGRTIIYPAVLVNLSAENLLLSVPFSLRISAFSRYSSLLKRIAPPSPIV